MCINSKENENIMSFHSNIIIFFFTRGSRFLTQDIQITNLQRTRQKLYDTNTGLVKLGKSLIDRNLLGIKETKSATMDIFLNVLFSFLIIVKVK